MVTRESANLAAVTAAVLISAIAALCEHLSVIVMPARSVIVLTLVSFLFDMVFTALFVSDAAEAVKRHRIKGYLLHGRGLLDFFGSVPLFFIFSAPSAIIIAAGTESAAVHFMKLMTYSWSTLCITGLLRVSRLARLASLPVLSGSGMTQRHITFICTVICFAALPVAPAFAYVLRVAGTLQYSYAVAGFIAALMLFVILAAVIIIYSAHFASTVSSVLDALDRGFRRREFYFKIKVREEFGDESVFRIASFYNESYLPAKIKQNINSPEPAAYRVPEEDVKNFIRNR